MVISEPQRRKLWQELRDRGKLGKCAIPNYEACFDPLKDKLYARVPIMNPWKSSSEVRAQIRPAPKSLFPLNALGSRKFCRGSRRFGLLITSGALTLGVSAVCLSQRPTLVMQPQSATKGKTADTNNCQLLESSMKSMGSSHKSETNLLLKSCLLVGAATAAITLCLINNVQ